MSLPTHSNRFILSHPPTDLPVLSGPSPTFSLQSSPLPSLSPNQVLLKSIHISNDPAQRAWITPGQDPARLYTTPVLRGQVMRSRNIAQVLASTSEKYQAGDLVLMSMGWIDHLVTDADNVDRKIEKVPGLSETQFLGALGLTGLTALYGVRDVARAGKGEVVVVSGAAGATGSMVVQIAKHMLGVKKVIGIAGEERKCRWVEGLGADVCLNYKDGDFREKMAEATPEYVEAYFDNVGGDILDFMLTRMKRFGRVAACGAITQYNKGEKDGLKNWFEVISNRIEIKGFIILDFLQEGKGPAAVGELVQAYKEGKIKLGDDNETVVETKFADVPKTWMMLFEGKNTGKLVTKIVDGAVKGSL